MFSQGKYHLVTFSFSFYRYICVLGYDGKCIFLQWSEINKTKFKSYQSNRKGKMPENAIREGPVILPKTHAGLGMNWKLCHG